jgi:hypothetical protein
MVDPQQHCCAVQEVVTSAQERLPLGSHVPCSYCIRCACGVSSLRPSKALNIGLLHGSIRISIRTCACMQDPAQDIISIMMMCCRKQEV